MKPRLFLPVIACLPFISITVFSQHNFNVKRTLSETRHQIVSSTFSPDGNYVVTTGSDSSLIIWNYDRKIIYRTLAGLKARPNTAAFLPGSNYIVSGGKDNTATLWDLTTMPASILRTFDGHKGEIKSLDITPDGKLLATGSQDKTVRIWDMQSSALIFELKGHSKDVNVVRFSPDGKLAATGGADGMINLWNISNGGKIAGIQGHKGYIRDMKFSSDGSLLASCGDDKTIYTWHIPDLSKSGTFTGHRDRVQVIDFSPDGKNIISGGWDKLIMLWDVSTQKPLAQSEKQKQVVVSLDISPSGPDFISSCYESEVLDIWILTGFDELQWKSRPVIMTAEAQEEIVLDKTFDKEAVTEKNNINVTKSISHETKMINIFSPIPKDGTISHNKNNITIVGQVSDSAGITAFLINRKPVTLSEAGIFQYTLNLKKGENILSLAAINSAMKMEELPLVIICSAEDALNETEEVKDISKSRFYALLIGINDYQDPDINDLDNPVRDAESLCNVLLEKYTFSKESVILLKDPSQEQLITALETLSKKLTSNDNLLIFYAGHGYWDDKAKIGYWLPSDATKNSSVKWFRNSTLRDFIGSIQTRHTILIADACFSGAIFKSRAAFTDVTQGIQKLYELPSRKAMTSGILQEVPDESMFIKYLVKRLDENQDKFLSSELLFSSFKIAVMNNSPVVPQFGIIQNVGDEGGDFIFIRK